jgi:hypothetical protein
MLAIPGFVLFATGLGLTVAAYAGRTTGNFVMALCGVACFLVGIGLLLSALIILVISLVQGARARREELLSQQYRLRHGG